MAAAWTEIELFTIGAYGATAERFLDAITNARIDTFVDIRARRGVRGSEYAFVNSVRLQNALAERGIAYVHLAELAPPDEIRKAQYAVDKASKVAKRQRTELSANFADSYRSAVLSGLDPEAVLAAIGSEAHRVALFCVEREPSACHRSLLAEYLAERLGVRTHNLLP
jgi:uncharacterized protein (DUF488 family)